MNDMDPKEETTAQGQIVEEGALDAGFATEVAAEPGGEGIRKCYACGTCTAGCPVRRFHPVFNPRRILRMVLLGMRDQVLKEPFVWVCATCYTCQERCPQGVRIASIMTALRNIAVRLGNMPEIVPMQVKLLTEKGTLYPLDDFDNKKRGKAGLPALLLAHEDVGPLLQESGKPGEGAKS
ncbi:MAG: heterodisulfide reductase [Deltaproteobacteria bacterium HGW-Deltaproteobacteria-21]|jgi:heterodisulfide reductase subunit C|nr:MAG: heterodisulfide reductase [Deltaproteobacteria bacterium HGW-Deltaproteobacteria-21]